MPRMVWQWVVVALMVAWVRPAQGQQQASAPPAAAPERALLNRYCVSCHNERLRTAELSLETMDVENVAAGGEVWEKVVRKLRTGAMPPAGAPRPDKTSYDSLTKYLEVKLDLAAESKPNPGRTTIHRLNRVEYTNAVRDLLAVDVDGTALLPADDSGRGFDNLAALLVVSPVLMERYLSAAGKITAIAIGDTKSIDAESTSYSVPAKLMQEDRASEDLPFGSRGGIAVRHVFPVDGEYSVKVRLARSGDGYIRGIRGDPHQLDVRLDGEQLRRFTVGGVRIGDSGPLYPRNGTFYRGDPRQIEYEFNADEKFEVRFPATAGTRLLQVAFEQQTYEPEGMLLPSPMYVDIIDFKGGNPAVQGVTITGPFNAKGVGETVSRHKIFACYPASGAPASEEASCAKTILSNLARRAYRRPVADADLQPLLNVYQGSRESADFESSIAAAVQAILVSPGFLFRIERDPAQAAPDTAYPVSDLELASRLSFFLWSSIPDDELLQLAERNQLRNPATLEQQVRRMLRDARSKSLVSNFAGQWLYLRNLGSVSPDPDVFPDFDDDLREAFRQEMELLFEAMLRDDRPVPDLLNADFTFLNERLARHYGIPGVYGSNFRRVTLQDEARKGILGKGSILTVTSHANRTSPVVRGKWVLENMLGTPPPPPPPDVPALDEKSAEAKALTMRQRMEQHRVNPACASCHRLMDPIGFSLDNFDAVGRWRNTEANNPIDASGVLPDGTKFSGPVEFREVLLGKREQFVNTTTEKLLTYALGRELQHFDAPAVRKILRQAGASEHRWSALILEIVKSVPFQMRRSRPS